VGVAQDGITVVSSDAETEFPTAVTFAVEAQSSSNITGIDLLYTVGRRSLVPVDCRVALDFTPAQEIETSWTWDMLETGGLPTGSGIEYHWLIEDETGNRVETTSDTINFDDLRYEWQSLTSGQVTFHWYEGDQDFIQELIGAAEDALGNLEDEFGVPLEQPADFYIYASAWELHGALVYPNEWTGGVAFPGHSTVVIGISPNSLTWGQRAIAHELGHLVVHQSVFGPFGILPKWLDEGLAMSAEGELRPDLQNLLAEAIAGDAIFSVHSLTGSFPSDPYEAELCYAESYSLVQFLRDSYGSDKLLELLSVFANGSTNDNALNQVYGFDSDGLDGLWRESLGLDPENPGYPSSPGGSATGLAAPYIVLLVLVTVLGIMTVYLGYLYIRRIW
jgi:hypothetical protein